jgi:hypothetical protein
LILELNIPFNVGFIFELGKLRALANWLPKSGGSTHKRPGRPEDRPGTSKHPNFFPPEGLGVDPPKPSVYLGVDYLIKKNWGFGSQTSKTPGCLGVGAPIPTPDPCAVVWESVLQQQLRTGVGAPTTTADGSRCSNNNCGRESALQQCGRQGVNPLKPAVQQGVGAPKGT